MVAVVMRTAARATMLVFREKVGWPRAAGSEDNSRITLGPHLYFFSSPVCRADKSALGVASQCTRKLSAFPDSPVRLIKVKLTSMKTMFTYTDVVLLFKHLPGKINAAKKRIAKHTIELIYGSYGLPSPSHSLLARLVSTRFYSWI